MNQFTGLTSVNWSEIENVGFEPLPAGTYGAKIVKAEVKDNKAGTGKNVVVQFSLLGEKGVKGRKITEYISVQNQNPDATRIGMAKLKDLIIKSGVSDPSTVNDISDITGNMVGLKLKVEAGRGDYGPQNRVQGFKEYTDELLSGPANDQDISF